MSELFKNGKNCLLCVSRQKLIITTPEEIVRQKFILDLVEKYGVPSEMIGVEVPLSQFSVAEKGRVDIVVFGIRNDDDRLVPLLLVECKNSIIPLTHIVFEQAKRYDSLIGPKVTVVTNGNETSAFQWDEEKEEYYFIDQVPSYKELITTEFFNPKDEITTKWLRPNHLSEQDEGFKTLKENGFFGEDSAENLYSFFANLIGLIHDDSESILSLNLTQGRFNKDCSVRYTTFGNASGGGWTGIYRSILLTEENGDSQIVSLSLMPKLKATNHPKYGNSKGHTMLLVAIDDFENSHLSLQLSIDRFTQIGKTLYTIWHDGTLTIGKTGSAKKQEVVDFIESGKPSLVKDNRILLGRLDNSKPFRWQSADVNEFVSNLVDYGLLRDKFRQTKRQHITATSQNLGILLS